MLVEEKKSSFKVEIDSEILESTRATFDRKKIGYWDGTEALFRWFIAQDGMMQSLILGQVEEKYRGQIAKMILNEIANEKPHRPGHFPTIAATTRDGPKDK